MMGFGPLKTGRPFDGSSNLLRATMINLAEGRQICCMLKDHLDRLVPCLRSSSDRDSRSWQLDVFCQNLQESLVRPTTHLRRSTDPHLKMDLTDPDQPSFSSVRAT